MSDTLKAGIYTALTGEASITGLVGLRIYPDQASETAALPYIVYQAPSDLGVHHLLGVTTLASTEIQFNVWAATSSSRTAVKNALREFLDGSIGVTFGSTFIKHIENTNNVDTKEDPVNGSQNGNFGSFMDFDFWHRR